jgi:hypothetical protein
MRPLSLKPKEVDLVVSALEQAIIFWNYRIQNEDFPEGFDEDVAENLYDDLFLTFIKFSDLQEEMNKDLEKEETELPKNVLKFPDAFDD